MGAPASPATSGIGAPGAPAADLTGQYLGAGAQGGQFAYRGPKIIPNPFDNTLLIQGTRQEYESIIRLLKDIDVPPRQVLIEAKIYEVSLTGELKNGVQAFLKQRSPNPQGRELTAAMSGGIALSVGALVDQSRELLLQLASTEFTTKARVLSAPSVIATDSIPATINVGDEVPTLTAQAVTGAQQGGNSLFANSIQSRNSGVTLNVMARVNPMGVVTMTINQEVERADTTRSWRGDPKPCLLEALGSDADYLAGRRYDRYRRHHQRNQLFK